MQMMIYQQFPGERGAEVSAGKRPTGVMPNRRVACTSLQTLRLVVFWRWLVLLWCDVVGFEVASGWLQGVMFCYVT